jgi:hypothetical protein
MFQNQGPRKDRYDWLVYCLLVGIVIAVVFITATGGKFY